MFQDLQIQLRQSQFPKTVSDSGSWFIVEMFKGFREKWYGRWRELEKEIAPLIATKADTRSKKQIERRLKAHGLNLRPQMTDEQKDTLREIVKTNIDNIKAIPQAAVAEMQKAVISCYEGGRDMQELTERIEKIRRVTQERAKVEARDQLNRATQAMTVVNAKAVGATKARWIHVPGYRSSRNAHKAFDGKPFDLTIGLWDEEAGQYVKPGELRYCNCTMQIMIPGFED